MSEFQEFDPSSNQKTIALRVHFRGTYKSNPHALDHLEAINLILQNQNPPNREEIEEEARIKARAIHRKSLYSTSEVE